MSVYVDVRPDLNALIHIHIFQRDIRRTNMRPILGHRVRQPHKAVFALLVGRVGCAVATAAVIALQMRAPEII